MNCAPTKNSKNIEGVKLVYLNKKRVRINRTLFSIHYMLSAIGAY